MKKKDEPELSVVDVIEAGRDCIEAALTAHTVKTYCVPDKRPVNVLAVLAVDTAVKREEGQLP